MANVWQLTDLPESPKNMPDDIKPNQSNDDIKPKNDDVVLSFKLLSVDKDMQCNVFRIV